MGAPPPTTAPAPSPAPGHPGHHLHHPGHHSHHPSRHLHHPGPQEGGGGQVDPGQIPGLQVSQDSIFHPPFAPLSNPPPPSPRPPSRNLDTQDTLILTGATLPSLMPLASLPISSWPTSLRTKDLRTKDSLEGYLLKALEDATRWPILLTSSSPPPPLLLLLLSSRCIAWSRPRTGSRASCSRPSRRSQGGQASSPSPPPLPPLLLLLLLLLFPPPILLAL